MPTLVILPGSKATIADLAALRAEGWDIDIRRICAAAAACSGLAAATRCSAAGRRSRRASKARRRRSPGSGLLDVETTLTATKRLEAVTGTSLADGAPFAGYEMHVGETTGAGRSRAPCCASPMDGRTGRRRPTAGSRGAYVHGLFADDRQRAAWLRWMGAVRLRLRATRRMSRTTLDALAAHLEAHIDCDRLLSLAR